VHNNLTHNSGNTKIADSVFFLLNYRETLLQVRQQNQPEEAKGKRKVWISCLTPSARSAVQALWEPLPEGWTKLNVDGSFVDQTGEAGVGVIIRNYVGEVILTAWRVIFRCASVGEAEVLACAKGLRLLASEFVLLMDQK
jgi:hypothetical protein